MYKEIINSLKREQVDVASSVDNPTFIFIGGQVGAGKTALANTILSQNMSQEFVVIDVDLYRKIFYDIYGKRANSNNIIEETSEFANIIEAELMSYAISEGKNIISSSSMRAKDLIEKIIVESLKPNGYTVDSALIITPFIECLLSAYERYENEIEKGNLGMPRRVDINFMKLVQKAYPETVQMLYDKKYVSTIGLYRRGKTASDKCILEKNIRPSSKTVSFSNLILEVESLCDNTTNPFNRISDLMDRLTKRNAEKDDYQVLYDIYEMIKNDRSLSKMNNRCSVFCFGE